MHIVKQAYFKVDSPKSVKLRRKMCVIKREPSQLYLIKYLFQTGTNSAIPDKIPFSDGNLFGTWGWSLGTNSVTAV
jgi:hypothetical protein